MRIPRSGSANEVDSEFSGNMVVARRLCNAARVHTWTVGLPEQFPSQEACEAYVQRGWTGSRAGGLCCRVSLERRFS